MGLYQPHDGTDKKSGTEPIDMLQGLRNYLVVTGGYWAFTVTDGAIRMLVVLYFHQLGLSDPGIGRLSVVVNRFPSDGIATFSILTRSKK